MILRTLHVDLFREWRGGQNQVLLLATELRSLGHVAEIVTLKGAPLAQRARAARIPVHEVTGRIPAAVRLRQLRGFDIVHCHEAHALTAAWLAGVDFVVSRRVAYPVSKRRYSRAKRIVAISHFVKESILASGLPDRQIEVIYDGVAIPEAPAEGGDGLQLGCVGWLLPEKGQELILRAMPVVLARYPAARLLLAGDGPSRRHLERLASELAVSAAVRFLGMVDEVDTVYRSLDVFVFPSRAEPLGSSLLAAMSYGLPCVAIARGAVPEAIENGKTGLLVDAPEPAPFAAAILQLLDDRSMAHRLGAAAREAAAGRFSVQRMAHATLELYRRVLARD